MLQKVRANPSLLDKEGNDQQNRKAPLIVTHVAPM